MGNICLDFRRRDWWGLNSHSPHTLLCPLLSSYSHVPLLAPYNLHFILLIFYNYIMCVCNVAHPGFAHSTRFSAYGRKSSRQCVALFFTSNWHYCALLQSRPPQYYSHKLEGIPWSQVLTTCITTYLESQNLVVVSSPTLKLSPWLLMLLRCSIVLLDSSPMLLAKCF